VQDVVAETHALDAPDDGRLEADEAVAAVRHEARAAGRRAVAVAGRAPA
jgi:hypothetical protein